MDSIERKKKTKFLKTILRHNPDIIGLMVDYEGWAYVDDLLACLANIKFKLSLDELKELMEEDPKGRFAFNRDASKVRATYGHSFPVDLKLPIVKPPETLYIPTGDKYCQDVEVDGFRLRNESIWLHDDYESALTWSKKYKSPKIFKVHTLSMWENGYNFYKDDRGIWRVGEVPAEYLELHADSNDLLPEGAEKIEWKIMVDADASPVINEVEALAQQYNISCVLMCDEHHRITSTYSDVYTIGSGPDAVDIALINQCQKGDIVITSDRGLIHLALGKEAYVVTNSGFFYSVDKKLERKVIHDGKKHMLPQNTFGRKNKNRTDNDNQRFVRRLDDLIQALLD